MWTLAAVSLATQGLIISHGARCQCLKGGNDWVVFQVRSGVSTSLWRANFVLRKSLLVNQSHQPNKVPLCPILVHLPLLEWPSTWGQIAEGPWDCLPLKLSLKNSVLGKRMTEKAKKLPSSGPKFHFVQSQVGGPLALSSSSQPPLGTVMSNSHIH